ncbi:MAG: FAD-dependent oxidoreductase [Anaerolineae bacterium]|nr:FAD-dependent oxidoreductase [Anaerolineae bacterium]
MTTHTADVLIIGGGVYGCATAYHLARLGAGKVVVLERRHVCAGGTAKSCAIVRTHYSVTTNLVHAVESLKIFAHFDEVVGGDVGWHRTGYLILGPEAHREPMLRVFAEQNAHGIDTAVLDPAAAHEIHPLLSYHDVEVIGYDTFTGYADPYLTTTAYANRARDLGVTIHTNTPVTRLSSEGRVKVVETTGLGPGTRPLCCWRPARGRMPSPPRRGCTSPTESAATRSSPCASHGPMTPIGPSSKT